jgi:hypothetical protein
MTTTQLDLTDAPSDGDTAVVMQGLTAFNTVDVGPSDRRALAVFIRDDDGKVIGGMFGYTGSACLSAAGL